MSQPATANSQALKSRDPRPMSSIGRWLTSLVALLFILGCAYADLMLIPQAIEANQKVEELATATGPQITDLVATQTNIRNSSWILAGVSVVLIVVAGWAIRLAWKRKYWQSWLTIVSCILTLLIAATLFKPF